MRDLKPVDYKRYKQMAIEHAEFLCEKVFKGAFHMAFAHGAKHMCDEMTLQIVALQKEIDERVVK